MALSAFPDANDCLLALHAAGLRLGLLTNFELPSIDRTLAHSGIAPALFTAKLCSGTLGVWKPDPRAYHAIAAAMNEPLSACAFIDDQFEHVLAARSLGMRAFLLDRSLAAHDLQSDLLCSLSPLPHLLIANE